MSQTVTKTDSRTVPWSPNLRFRVGESCSHSDAIWSNLTGSNKEPGTSNDWELVNYLTKDGSRRRKVIDIVDNTQAPPTEVFGDRYILDFTGGGVHADWDGASAGDIVQFNDVSWDAQRPEEGWITFVDDQDADYRFVDDGTPAWEKLSSAQNTSDLTNDGDDGVNPFINQNDIPTNLSSFNDDIGATDSLTTNTCFIDSINGDDTTAQVENGDRPYKTLQAALNDLSGTGENPSVFIKFIILDSSNYELNDVLQGLINFEIYSDFRCTVDFSNNSNYSLWYTSNPVNEYNVSFNLPNGTIKRDRSGSSGVRVSYEDLLLTINVGTIENNSSSPFLGGRNVYVANLQTLISSSSGTTFSRINGDISINNLIVNNTQHDPLNAAAVTGFITLKKISGTGGYHFKAKNASEASKYIVGDISTDLQCKLHYVGSGGQQVDIEFKNSTITTPGGILLGNQTVGQTTISGNIKSTPRIDFASTRIGTVRLVNFVADFGDGNIDIGATMKLIIENCSLKFDSTMSGIYTTSLPDVLTVINSTIEQRTPAPLTIGGNNTHTIEAGSLNTNAISISDNSDVNITHNLISFKNKSQELVVRSKTDIVDRVLNDSITYIIDGEIELLAGEFIEIPSGGNITLNGYGLEASKIIKNVAGESIFRSPVGGSGGLQIDSLKFVMENSTTSCFDLSDATGFNAVECVKVNFEGSGNIGKLNGYRQGLWTNIGIFGLSDGLTFEGAWIGGFVTETVIVRNLTGTTGTLFKKGVALTFASRFTTDGNIDVPAGWTVADFEDANFTNDNTFQIQKAIISRAGVFDDTDSNYFPNIDEEDDASQWSENTGVPNSSLLFEKLKSPNGTVYKLEVDNTGTLTTTSI